MTKYERPVLVQSQHGDDAAASTVQTGNPVSDPRPPCSSNDAMANFVQSNMGYLPIPGAALSDNRAVGQCQLFLPLDSWYSSGSLLHQFKERLQTETNNTDVRQVWLEMYAVVNALRTRMDRRLIRVFACAQKALGRAHNNDIVRSCDFPAYWKECFPRRADALLHYIDLHDLSVTAFKW